MDQLIRWLNLALLVLYPVAWFAPLMRAGMLPLFGLTEISVVSGIQSLWVTDRFLAVAVASFALVAPMVKTLGLALLSFGKLPRTVLGVLNIFGKLAMADIFLIAVYITVIKGMGVGRIEVAWGLYLFTFCILASLLVGLRLGRISGSDVDVT